MRISLAARLLPLAASAHAAFLSTSNSTISTTITTITTPTFNTTSTTSPTPTPTGYVMRCGGSLDGLCGDVCFCSGGTMNCHADPSARCYQMCTCGGGAEMPREEGERRRGGWMGNR